MGFFQRGTFHPEDLSTAKAAINQTNVDAYQKLDAKGQERYVKILNALLLHHDSVFVSNMTKTEALAAYRSVIADHPEIFWVDTSLSWESSTGSSSSSLRFHYTHTAQQAKAVQQQIDALASSIMVEAAAFSTQYEKALFIHDYLVTTTSYALEAPNGQSIIGALLDHQAVCASYAKSFQFLSQKAGIACAYVTGTVDPTIIAAGMPTNRHAWNRAIIDGSEAYIDVTFDDPIVVGGGELAEPRYDFFCISGASMAATHTPDSGPISSFSGW